MDATVKLHDLYFEPLIKANKIQERITELGASLAKDFAHTKPLFLPVLNGAFIFAADLSRACPIDHEVNFIKLTSYSGTVSSGKITTQIGLQDNLAGKAIILLEDIVDTGNTLHHFLPTLKAACPASITIVSFLLKPTALKYPLDIDYVGFKIPDKFVVGYGLDYNDLGRNLKDVYQLKEKDDQV